MQAFQEYVLPPDKLVQAIEFAHTRYALHFAAFLVSVIVLVAVTYFRLVPRMKRFHPIWIVVAVMLLTSICDLPAETYGHSVSLRYAISIQGWPSWMWDWVKEQLLSTVIAIAVLVPFYWLLRKSPKRWWVYTWLVSIPVLLLSAYADPLLVEPLFNTFQPLSAKHPGLIAPIEELLARAGVRIPRDHLFEMAASEKTNSLNAYVTGFGPSKRVVLYDTIIEKENGPPLMTTIGHELGHYVLNHIPKGLAMGSVSILLTLWILSVVMPGLVSRWGARFDILRVSDWASLPVFLLSVLVLSFVAEPLVNAYSRSQEHEADLYSLEVTHGLIANPGQAAAQAFQVEGETDLDEPHPNPFIVFWLYSHPPVADRLRFSLEYNPWAKGASPKFVK